MPPLRSLDEVFRELDELIGLREVKELVREIYAYAQIQRKRQAAGLTADTQALHMVFRGNPGTGKTTVARLLGEIFRSIGVLPRGHLVEVERADLVGEYVGHTAQKTREQVRRAVGGILFVDEAYSLARGGDKDFGKEAIDTLVKAMEDYRGQLVLILAGYRMEMDMFLASNPGLRSRFPVQIDFPDYTVEELLAIARQMLRRSQYELTADAQGRLLRYLRDLAQTSALPHGNARLVRNLVERAIRRQAVRLVRKGTEPTRAELMQIHWADIESAIAATPDALVSLVRR